jgi:hypothetical protein
MAPKIIQGISIFDTVNQTQSTNKMFQKKFLDRLEIIMDKNDPKFAEIRKLYLDTQNEFTRSIINETFGGNLEN